MFDYKTNDYFALIKSIPGGWSFTSYSHNGESFRAIQGFNRDGMPKNFTFFFGDREGMYVVPKNKTVQVIVNNNPKEPVSMKVSEYLKKSGYCVGEFQNSDPMFKFIDENKDAAEVVDLKTRRIKAEMTAVDLKGAELTEMAQLLGEFSDNKDIQKRIVLEFSGKDPSKFMSIYTDPLKEIKSLVRKAIKSGVCKQNGKVIVWGQEVLGNEESAVEKLNKDTTQLKALKEAVKSFK